MLCLISLFEIVLKPENTSHCKIYFMISRAHVLIRDAETVGKSEKSRQMMIVWWRGLFRCYNILFLNSNARRVEKWWWQTIYFLRELYPLIVNQLVTRMLAGCYYLLYCAGVITIVINPGPNAFFMLKKLFKYYMIECVLVFICVCVHGACIVCLNQAVNW